MAESILATHEIFSYILIQFLLYLGPGYLLLQKRLKRIPIIFRLPIYIATGMLVIVLILCGISPLYVGKYPLIAIAFVSYAIIIVQLVRSNKMEFRYCLNLSFKSLRLNTVIPFFTMMFLIFLFSFIAGYLGWPPLGDAVSHGFLTGLLVHNQGLQNTLAPVAPSQLWFEPFGLHVLAASLSLLFNIFPGIAVLTAATTIITLILMVVYSLTYLLTRSILFSSAALLCMFYVSSMHSVEYWLIGYYYNGPYANLFGYLGVLTYVTVQFGIPYAKGINKMANSASAFLSLLASILIYPPVAVLPIIHLAGASVAKKMNFSYRVNPVKFLTSKRYHFTLKRILLLLLAAAIIVVTFLILPNLLDDISTMASRVYIHAFAYSLSPSYFISDLNGPIIMLTMLGAAISIIKGKLRNLSTFYLFISTMLLLSTWLGDLWFLLPRRLLIFVSILSWVLLLTYAHLLTLWISKIPGSGRSWVINTIAFRKYLFYLIVLVPLTALFLPDLISHMTLEGARSLAAWFPHSPWFKIDHDLISWMVNNVEPEDLVMVRSTYASSFIYSFAVSNLTTSYPFDSAYERGRGLQNDITWDRPELMKQFVTKYDVKYVLVLSEPASKNLRNLGGDGLYYISKYTPSQLRSLLERMEFLEPIKTFESSTLYKVNLEQ